MATLHSTDHRARKASRRGRPWSGWVVGFAAAMCAALLGWLPLTAAPSSERTVVQAVADGSEDRILVRWLLVEGTSRFSHYDVLRRAAGETSLIQLNEDPIGPLESVTEIQALFTQPGFDDALSDIQDTLGMDYANALLALQAPTATSDQKAQLRLLPDLNYGAAIALGVGLMDEDVVPGQSYVYEVWGLDSRGFRVDRLGRAVASTGEPPALSGSQELDCVDLGDVRGDMAAFLRWDDAATGTAEYAAGYDVLRVERNSDGTCPPIGQGTPGVVQANRYATRRQAPGSPRRGAQLFNQNCTSCHSAANPRRTPLSQNGVQGGTMQGYYRRQNPDLWPTDPTQAKHQGVNVGTRELQAIFDWIHEFHYRDAGRDTPSEPLESGQTYCYQVVPRDLLGQHGSPSPTAECTVLDRKPPDVPFALRVERIPQAGSHEICSVSWRRNQEDGTTHYELTRVAEPPQMLTAIDEQSPMGWPKEVPQPGAGSRVSFTDSTMDASTAAESWFYGVRAIDEAKNRSAWAGWIPCVPRDLAAPGQARLTPRCCTDPDPSACDDKGEDRLWTEAGGDEILITDPARCPVDLECSASGDLWGCRLLRSFDDVTYASGKDFVGTQPVVMKGTFAPRIDQKIWIKGTAFDKSYNMAVPSEPVSYIVKGQYPLPPPRIVQVALLDDSTGRVEITFRSVEPNALLGFALYKQHEPQGPPADQGDFVVRFADQNLSADPPDPSQPDQWAVLPGATTLDQLPDFFDPPWQSDPSIDGLYYDQLDGVYVMRTVLGESHDLVLRLMAIGWSGEEGESLPYSWDGFTANDDVLEWPEFRDVNRGEKGEPSVLAATYDGAFDAIRLEWEAYPDGCENKDARPFIVFRKRAGAKRWAQISPPFRCAQDLNPNLEYRDRDVETGFSYTYTVIRLSSDGEFDFQYGPETEAVP